MTDFAVARLNMVEGQIKPNRVYDRALIEAMLTVPRELFVPKSLRGIAYVDEAIRIGEDRYLTEPMVLGRLLEEAQLRPEDIALDVGCGTGYSTAVMAHLVNTVVAVESDPDLARQATKLLTDLGVDNAAVMTCALSAGYAAQGPYDCILVDGAVAEVPQALTDQLADGGRLVTVLLGSNSIGKGMLFKRAGKTVSRRELFEAGTPVLPGFEPKPAFEF
jgi:protein-L-isoaspartate(D-aspartate) O-methyltransferase